MSGDYSALNPQSSFQLAQCFGEPAATPSQIAEEDTLSAVSFDLSGYFLATGDKGGRIVIFSKVDSDDEFQEESQVSY